MKNSNINIEEARNTHCVYCGTKVRLNSEEIESRTFFCSHCRRENVVWGLRQDYQDNIVTSNHNGFVYILGVISALILIFLLPRLFGIL